jgi:threonine dehydrogenase-like Zn-dependent dehydrogenase
VIRHARVPAGSRVLVVGCGGVGLNVVHGARLPGARPIVAVDLRDDELDYAKAFEAAINATPGCGRTVPRMTDGRGVERPFDAIGREKSALQVIDAVAPGGRAVLVGPARGGQGDDKPFRSCMAKRRSAALITARRGRISIFRCSPVWISRKNQPR